MTSRLRFSPGAHRYSLTPVGDGKPETVPSVTQLLNMLSKPALVRWAAKAAADFAINEWDSLAALPISERHTAILGSADAMKNRAAVKGTEIHALAERLLHGKPVEAAPDVLPKVQAVARFLETSGIRVELTEARVYSDADDDYEMCAYAGTFDAVAKHPRYGRLLVDWKSGSGPWPEMALQLGAYAYAEMIQLNDEDVAMWHVDGGAVAMVGVDTVDLHMLDRKQLRHAAHMFDLLRQLKYLGAVDFQQVTA